MSTPSDIPQRPARRSRRNPKTTQNLSDARLIQTSSNNVSHPQASGPNFQPTQILSRKVPDMTPTAGYEPSMTDNLPSTPPRHSQTPQAVTHNGNRLSSSVKSAGTKQQKSAKTQGTHQKATPKINQSEAMESTQRSNTLTPGRDTGTPSRAYAGPTFHASPAASSLPMPKMFSRSVPNVNKTASLKHMMEQTAPISASENEDSPFVDRGEPSPSRQVREASPLDIFFQADRKAKADRAISTPNTGLMPSNISQGQGTGSDISPSKSRNHSRHPTNGSGGGIFPIELESLHPNSISHSSPSPQATSSQRDPFDRSNSAPLGALTNHQTPEQHRHAQTIALKKMLFAQRPPGSLVSLGTDAPPLESKQFSAATNVVPTQSKAPCPIGDPDTKNAQRKAALLALAHKQISDGNHASQRPGSSGLSKEMVTDHTWSTQYDPQPPSTPTSNHASKNLQVSALPHNASGPEIGSHAKLDPQNSHRSPLDQTRLAPKNNTMTAKSIEDDLRRILKLEVQHSAGAT